MKIKFLLSIFLLIAVCNTTAYASFPVLKKAKASTTVSAAESPVEFTTPAAVAGYDKWVAVAFWFFLGGFAAHRWYAKKPVGWNILFILTLGGLGIWAIVDLINILTDKFQ